MTQITRIDPPGCACTDCITGCSVPLDSATASQVFDMLSGRLTDATSHDFSFQVTVTSAYGQALTWTKNMRPAQLFPRRPDGCTCLPDMPGQGAHFARCPTRHVS